ncbi:UDP-Glycosyltransferase/glycogen phosphorylase [Thozetella sp. PMI_491]|nr:UDP-Glycosyltransferase/glycogen phosphorylase [Thozetella sp. PMI_491]
MTTHAKVDEVKLEAPPAYELHSHGTIISSSAALKSDGTIDIELSSSNAAQLEQLLPLPSLSTTDASPSASILESESEHYPQLNIVIHVVGSRGDVQPFIAYGTELRRQGHRVRLATHDCFSQFVRNSGLEFYPIGGDPTDLMAYMVKNPGLIPSLESLRGGDVGKKRRMMKEILQGCWSSCIEPDSVSKRPFVADVIIANPPSFAHIHCAQALGIPVHIMFTMPWTATRAFPHPLVNMHAKDMEPATANWLSYGLVELMTWQGLGDVINEWRKRQLELDEIANAMGPSIVSYLHIPHTYCWSPALVSKPMDWGADIDVCGFFMRDDPVYAPPPDLEAFLDAGPPPLYVGFGSIVLDDPGHLHQVILEATRRCGVRVIISQGWSKLGGDSPSTTDVFYLGDCPHEWLFKKVSAVVHHGGAGTTACGLINARPTLIVPFFGDQPFWGSVVAAAGAGAKPIPHKQLQVDNLNDAIKYITSPPAYDAARNIADAMQKESGVEAAVRSLYRHLPLAAMSCDLVPNRAARWVLEERHKRVKLSDEAVVALVAEKRIKLSNLKSLRPKEYDTDVRRWDPLSGGAASTFGTLTDFTTSLGGLFIDPYKAYKRTATNSNPGASAAAAAKSAGNSLASMTGVLARGTLVDVPLALAEGMKNVPKLYGEEVPDHGKVKDWQSGSVVAAKNFGSGFYHGVTGVVTQPLQGAKKEGIKGFLKGAGKGTIGLVTKPGAALFGLVGYPALGIKKSLTARKGLERAILESKGDQVDEFALCLSENHNPRQITARFDNMFSSK